MKNQWITARLLAFNARPPFSFVYGDQPSERLLAEWPKKVVSKKLDDHRTQHTFTWTDSKTGLEVRCVAVDYADYPAVEWTVYFKNTGMAATPLIEDIQALATSYPHESGDSVVLHRSRGSNQSMNDFAYRSETLDAGETMSMVAGKGRSSDHWLPFFNLQIGANGIISAIGWTGQWAAEFTHGSDGKVFCRAGMEKTHLRLQPGEEIRTPRMLLLFWENDRLAGHNQLRRFILQYHTPRSGGRRLEGPLTVLHWGGMKTSEHLERIRVYTREKLDYDYYWIDAGWYGPEDSYSPDDITGDWAKHVGNWNVNPKAHPNGLRPISDAANAAGMKFLLWFEPERAVFGTPLTMDHPEWFLGERKENAQLLFDLGNPEACRWMTDSISRLIQEHGVSLYRQDFNFNPLPFWREADTPDRQGMTEIRHVEGLYRFWDTLLERFPDLVIDNCASGGRRIDLETTGRSIPLWRSDFQCSWTANPIGSQRHGMGLSYWVPLSGTGVIGFPGRAGDTYNFRSALSAALTFGIFPFESFPIEPNYPYDWHRRMLAEYRRLRPLFRGDYYPLTELSASPGEWVAYQMHHDDQREGCVLAFRREQCKDAVRTFRLHGLDPAARYEVSNFDVEGSTVVSGKELMNKGLTVEIKNAPFDELPPTPGCMNLALPAECVVFGPFSREDRAPAGDLLRRVPAEITLGGAHAVGRSAMFDSGRTLDVESVIKGFGSDGQGAFIYIPFQTRAAGSATFGFGADWWYEAYLDGVVISETLSSGGNQKPSPPSVRDHTVTVELPQGEHLLVVRFVRGKTSAWLAVGGPLDLEDQRTTAPGSVAIAYRQV